MKSWQPLWYSTSKGRQLLGNLNLQCSLRVAAWDTTWELYTRQSAAAVTRAKRHRQRPCSAKAYSDGCVAAVERCYPEAKGCCNHLWFWQQCGVALTLTHQHMNPAVVVGAAAAQARDAWIGAWFSTLQCVPIAVWANRGAHAVMLVAWIALHSHALHNMWKKSCCQGGATLVQADRLGHQAGLCSCSIISFCIVKGGRRWHAAASGFVSR